MKTLLCILLSPFVLNGKKYDLPKRRSTENENGNNEKTTQQILNLLCGFFFHTLLSGVVAPSMA